MADGNADDASDAPPTAGWRGRAATLLGLLRLRRDGRRFAEDARRGRALPPAQDGVKLIGPDPVRVLLAGGEYALGFGSPTRAAALDGAIAEVLSDGTGRGVIVENRARDGLRLVDLPGSLGGSGAHTFDVVVWAPSFAEVGRHLALRPWREGVSGLVEAVRGSSRAGVLLLSIPRLTGANPLAVIARWRAAQIEHALRDVADRYDRVFVVRPPAVPFGEIRTISGPDVYRQTARLALPALLEALGSPSPRGSAAPVDQADTLPEASDR